MTITQTVEIPANHRITLEVPVEIPAGRTIIAFIPVSEAKTLCECPICTRKLDPVTGNPHYNTETIAAIEEGRAMIRGEIPSKRFNSLDDMWDDLMKDDLAN